MAKQSKGLSAETQVMRAIDLALQKVDELTGRTRERVLRYAADQVADRLGSRTSVGVVGYAGGSGGAAPQSLIAGGGASADWLSAGGAVGYGDAGGGVLPMHGSVTVVPHDGPP